MFTPHTHMFPFPAFIFLFITHVPPPSTPHTPQVDIVQRRVDLMAAEGVRFVTSAHVGRGVDVAAIRAASDALVLAAGATKPRDLPIEGR